MASKKQEQKVAIDAPVGQLTLVNFDDIENIETEETTPAQSEQPSEPAPVESEEQVLATVETFDSAFANDPCKQEYLDFGNDVKAGIDPSDLAVKFVGYGLRAYNIMVKERNIAPGAYDRAKIMKKFETALRLCNVSESMVKPQEITAVFWLARLDRSTPGAEGEARTFDCGEPEVAWFGGNITLSTLRVLSKCIDRASKNDELDVWEFKEGFEPHVREWIKRLREGYLSLRQVETLIQHRKKTLANERKAQKYQGLNADEIASIEAAEKNASLQSRLTELGSLALGVQKFAAEELKKSPADVRDFLANKGIIPPDRFPTVDEIAAHLTPGDAKSLVQSLIKQYVTKPDRLAVFKVLRQTCNQVVAQLQSARESAKKVG
jgi:DNA-binding transcriptional MerR regulator